MNAPFAPRAVTRCSHRSLQPTASPALAFVASAAVSSFACVASARATDPPFRVLSAGARLSGLSGLAHRCDLPRPQQSRPSLRHGSRAACFRHAAGSSRIDRAALRFFALLTALALDAPAADCAPPTTFGLP